MAVSELQVSDLMALELKPGGVYVIECEERLPIEAFERLRESVRAAAEHAGVKLLVLDKGLKIVRASELPSPDADQTHAKVNENAAE